MMPGARWSGVSATASLTLDEVVARLSARPAVEGLLTIGTTRVGRLTLTSDYDLVVVLTERPVPVHVGLGTIDGRLADLLFVDQQTVRDVVDRVDPLPAHEWVGRTARWLHAGEIRFDRHGLLRAAQDRVRARDHLRPVSDLEAYGVWFGINYNLKQTERMLAAEDAVSLEAVDLRLAYMVMQAVAGYFTVRGLLWEGEKAALRSLKEYDPNYHACLSGFFAASDRRERFRLYAELARRSLAPMGVDWPTEETAFTFDSAAMPDTQPRDDVLRNAIEWWEDLTGAR